MVVCSIKWQQELFFIKYKVTDNMAYSILDFAEEVLLQAEIPLTISEIWNSGVNLHFDEKLKLTGKTPINTLGAQFYVDVRDNQKSRFLKIGKHPARFFLAIRKDELSNKDFYQNEFLEQKPSQEVTEFNERALHPLLTYFVYANPSFSRGRAIYTKTIYHEKSKKSGYNEWLHPDMVGFYLPLSDWSESLIEFNKLSEHNVIKLFSFELKKFINKGNYREAYFQAVSNSSWANEGYLVTADISEDDDLLAELERLNMSFGIGIIFLNLNDFDASKVLFPARIKPNLDWETMNKLCETNPDFMQFLKDVRIDFQSAKIHKSEYDAIITESFGYIQKTLLKNESSF